MLGNRMTLTNGIFRFVQRALWIYIAEAVLILALIFMFHAFT
jgi:hypothetical protein